MLDRKIVEWTANQLKQGYSEQQIKQYFLQKGYTQKDIDFIFYTIIKDKENQAIGLKQLMFTINPLILILFLISVIFEVSIWVMKSISPYWVPLYFCIPLLPTLIYYFRSSKKLELTSVFFIFWMSGSFLNSLFHLGNLLVQNELSSNPILVRVALLVSSFIYPYIV